MGAEDDDTTDSTLPHVVHAMADRSTQSQMSTLLYTLLVGDAEASSVVLVGSGVKRSAADGAGDVLSTKKVGGADTSPVALVVGVDEKETTVGVDEVSPPPKTVGGAETSPPVVLVVGVNEKEITVGVDEVSSPPMTVGGAETSPPGVVVVGDSVEGAPTIGAADGEVELLKTSSSSIGVMVGASDISVKTGATLGG